MFYDCINTIYQFIETFLDNKMSIFEEYGAFKSYQDNYGLIRNALCNDALNSNELNSTSSEIQTHDHVI